MRYLFNYIIVCLCTVMLFACSTTLEKRVERGLEYAGDNRKELDKVLQHYSNDPEKLKAAQFLIANMPYYYTYSGWEIDSLKNVLKAAIPFKGYLVKEVKDKWQKVHFQQNSRIYDSHVVTSDLLIENIDLAFAVWEKRPWAKYYSFDDFCEYILPYRIEDEPLESWRRMYYQRYASVLDSLYQGNDVLEAAKVVVAFLKKEGFVGNKDFTLPHFGASFLMENRIGYCRENCDIATYALRALGIPVTTDFYQSSPVYQSKHYWSALIDTTGLPVLFNYIEEEMARGYQGKRKKGKVFRRMFEVQPEKYDGIYTDATIPKLFSNPFIKDVSGDYFGNVAKVTIPTESSDRFIYLAVWNGRSYEPIDMVEVKRGKGVFKELEKDVVYHPVFNNQGQMKAAYYPFQIGQDSVVHFFIPDKSKPTKREVKRKYPMRGNIRAYLNHIEGVKIEADNRKDFRNAHLIYHIVDTPLVNYNKVILTEPVCYRYYRFLPLKTRRIQLAELGLYTDTLAQARLAPVAIIPDTVINAVQLEQVKWTTDDDWVSNYYSETRGKPLIFDFGKPVEAKSLVYIPRSDDNFVRAGDTYELFYQDGARGWVSLGKQTATTYYVVYDNVPYNALLWLRNHTRGKEERAFYYENEVQIFP